MVTKQKYPLLTLPQEVRKVHTDKEKSAKSSFAVVFGRYISVDSTSICFFYEKKLVYYWEVLYITELMINEQIRDKEIRLIDENGEQLGIVSSREAQKLADERRLDLVKIAPTAKPPVCRIMDYGKYKFDQTKKEKEARKKQKTVDIKELRLSPSIDTHDVQVKVKKAIEFLKNGDRVKVSIRFRGREIGHSKTSAVILENFAKDVEEYGVIDKAPKMEAKTLVMFLAPKN